MTRHAIITVDLGFGDAGKGSIVDFLTRQTHAHTIVRFNGGSQAAHNVVTPDGRHHTFAQFGSGSLVVGVKTYLSRYMLIDPYAMFNEADHLAEIGAGDILERLYVDRSARIISPYQQVANRLKELARGDARHGSCGVGIGETVADSLAYPELAIVAGDLNDPQTTRRKLHRLRDLKQAELANILPRLHGHPAAQQDLATLADRELIDIVTENYAYLADQIAIVDDTFLGELLEQAGTIIFEAAQGVLLDENHGFHPYTTWSNTTTHNALMLLQEHRYGGDVTRLGILRSYATRHGAGPFVTEDERLVPLLEEHHNGTGLWQGVFRVGYFDRLATRYALAVTGGVDAIALTHVDAIEKLPHAQICTAYARPDGQILEKLDVYTQPDLAQQSIRTQQLLRMMPIYQPIMGDYVEAIAEHLSVPMAITSHGQTATAKQILPAWQHLFASRLK